MKLLPLLAVALLTPVVRAQSDPASVATASQVSTLKNTLNNASSLPDATKADRFNVILLSDSLHLEYLIYLSDARYAPRETKELAAVRADLDAIDEITFPSIDKDLPNLVIKASRDFKKLYDKDQELQNELQA